MRSNAHDPSVQRLKFRFEVTRFPDRLQARLFSTRCLVLGLDEKVVQLDHPPG